MNKRLLLLAGILVLGATTFAAHTPAGDETPTLTPEKAAEVISITDSTAIKGLLETRQEGIMGEFSGSYAGEVRVRSWQGAGRSTKVPAVDSDGKANAGVGNYSNSVNKVEWTVAEGKLNMGKIGFAYSADRDYKFDKNWNKQSEGWDTKFGLDYKGGTFDMMGKEWTFVPGVAFSYDTSENFTSDASDPKARDSESKRRWDFTPKISTTYYGFAMDISPIVAYDDVAETTAFELDVTNYRALGTEGYWSTWGDVYLDFAGSKKNDSYSNSVFNGNIDADNKFALSIEQYLGYEREVAANTYFITEFGLEAYSILQSEANNVAMYAAPELQYRAKLGQANVVPYVKYITYSSTGAYENTGSDAYAKEEVSVGVRFSTSF
jgi:hypothetical protein